MSSFWRSCSAALAWAVVCAAALSSGCSGSGLSKDDARPFVALSLSSAADLNLASFIGSFCESDEGRRLRTQPNDGAVPSNAQAFGHMAGDALLKKLMAAGYVDATEETLDPDAGEARHPACGKRDICRGCPVISTYHVVTYRLTATGKDMFLVTPVTEDDFMRLYNTGPTGGPFDDVQQAFGDDMPLRISLVVATKAFDVTGVTTDAAKKTARVSFDWYWKPGPRIDKTPLRPLIPAGRNRATVQLKQMEDGWHLDRDAAPLPE